MSVHPDGSGTGWTEDIDVDQPHGLDYRSQNDLRIGVRKRLQKEHVEPADATVGGEHIGGGCAILALTDATNDITTGADDGTYIGRGLIYDQTTNSFWCFTNDGTAAALAGPLQLKLAAGSFCLGGDYTWTGHHQFDGTVDFTTINVDGTADFYRQVDFSNVAIDGTLTVLDQADFSILTALDVSIATALDVDGTSSFFDEVDVSDINVTGTMTASSGSIIGAYKAPGTGVFSDTMTAADTWQDLDLSAVVGARSAIVYLQINADGAGIYGVKEKGRGNASFAKHYSVGDPCGAAVSHFAAGGNENRYLVVTTDSSGVIQHASVNNTVNYVVTVLGYVA